jgi:hypothetical protein
VTATVLTTELPIAPPSWDAAGSVPDATPECSSGTLATAATDAATVAAPSPGPNTAPPAAGPSGTSRLDDGVEQRT